MFLDDALHSVGVNGVVAVDDSTFVGIDEVDGGLDDDCANQLIKCCGVFIFHKKKDSWCSLKVSNQPRSTTLSGNIHRLYAQL